MTEGTSQGLFVVVAIVIFGIFIGLTYTLFGSEGGLSNDLKGLFENSIESVGTVFLEEGLQVTYTENEDGTYKIVAENTSPRKNPHYLISLDSDNKGINYLPNSDFTTSLENTIKNYPRMVYSTRGGVVASIDDETRIKGSPTYKLDFRNPSLTETNDATLHSGKHFKNGEYITVSFDAYSLEESILKLRFGRISDGVLATKSVPITTEETRYSITLKKESWLNDSLSFSNASKTIVHLTNIKIEYGEFSTDYTPSEILTKDSLTVTAKEKGIYTFKMQDFNGKYFTKSIEIK